MRHTLHTLIITLMALTATGASARGTAPGEDTVEPDYKYINTVNPDAKFTTVKNGGILIVGSGRDVRAMESYGGTTAGMQRYARVANEYARMMPGVNVYCMPLPTQVAFYAPDAAAAHCSRVRPRMLDMFNALGDSAIAVDIYPTLGRHADEVIYTRTDHHWASLGAYYAASQLARAAGVPFADISQYRRHEIPGYVGTMYKFSGSEAVRNAPETFYYYTPVDTTYTTTFTDFKMDSRKTQVLGVKEPYRGKYFANCSGSAAYGTFGGGDYRIIKVETGVGNGRRLLIIKDSYGNALTPFLFGSFEQVHVVDGRYFPYNIVKYVRDNGITDVVLCNNMLLAGSSKTASNIERYLHK